MIRFASLSSGSKGNCLVAESGRTRVMIDCGLGVREATRRLAQKDLLPGDITAIFVTHEHDDHVGGVCAFAQEHGAAVFMTHGTWQAVREAGKWADGVAVQVVDGRTPVAAGDLQLRPFTVPHDAREPVQYLISDGAFRLGVLTDLGVSTPHVEQMLGGCDALVLECNHDLDILRQGDYPQWLKDRIAGPFGHLDNGSSARLLSSIDRSRLQHVIGAHLSAQNNRPELARAALARALGCEESWIGLATQEDGFAWRELR